MYEDFKKYLEAFGAAGVDDPMGAALRLFDILSAGALRNADRSYLDRMGLEPVEIARRIKDGTPLEYVLGIAPFMGLTLFCTPETLIPRHDTELLAQTALNLIERMGRPLTVVDMGTGSGNVAVAIAMNAGGVKVLAADVSPGTVDVARRNVDKYSLQERVLLFCGDLFEPLRGRGYEGTIDMIVCNPPYIPTSSLEKLAPSIVKHEPRLALDAGAYGIDIFKRLIAEAGDFLKAGGVLAFEIGAGQERLSERLLAKNGGYGNVEYYTYDGRIRVVSAVRR